MGPASLGEATGISSAYHSTKIVEYIPNYMENVRNLLGFHKAKYFDMQEWETHDVLLTDDGGYDLYGIYPALRRQVPNVMVFNCNGKSLGTMDGFTTDKDLPARPGTSPYKQLFGRCADKENKQRQVFDSAGFDTLINAIQNKLKAGDAPIHVERYQVLTNDHLGIKGGWEVRIMWIMNERMKKWETQLPEATRSRIPPMTEQQMKEQLMRGQLTTEQLTTEQLTTEQLTTEQLTTEQLTTEQLTTEQLTTEQLTTEQSAPKPCAFLQDMFPPAELINFPHVDTMKLDYTSDLVSLMANHAAWMLINNENLVRDMFELAPKPQLM
ncbi:hypothetical protein VaNZ11_014077 [Volvox africanus]|uniref:Uncharacterized protein n=1 Tax=Volvox africanus TaxID=51714 RepID=A0ABQ5SII9_9CHLO|nr:hypothetical protein VaNZ11_014077 [Volvox africanus]